jgi:hypothetical protein
LKSGVANKYIAAAIFGYVAALLTVIYFGLAMAISQPIPWDVVATCALFVAPGGSFIALLIAAE